MAFFNPYTANAPGSRPTSVPGIRSTPSPADLLRGGGTPPAMGARPMPRGIPGGGPRTRTPLPRGAGVVRRPPPTATGRVARRGRGGGKPPGGGGRPPVRLDYNKIPNIPNIPGSEAAAFAAAQRVMQQQGAGMGGPPGAPPGAPPGGLPGGLPAAPPTLMAGGIPGVGQPGAVTGGPPGAGLNTGQVAGMGTGKVRRRTA